MRLRAVDVDVDVCVCVEMNASACMFDDAEWGPILAISDERTMIPSVKRENVSSQKQKIAVRKSVSQVVFALSVAACASAPSDLHVWLPTCTHRQGTYRHSSTLR